MANEVQIVKESKEKLIKWIDVETQEGYSPQVKQSETTAASAEEEGPSAEDKPLAEEYCFGV